MKSLDVGDAFYPGESKNIFKIKINKM